MYSPKEDGITHINIYTKSSTELGRYLSNLSDIPLIHPEYGNFRCIEGFWYWYLTGMQFDDLRITDGFQSKTLGKKLSKSRVDKNGLSDLHKKDILLAISYKIYQNDKIKNLIVESSLPFTHYYYYGSVDNPKIYELPNFKWITDYLEELRVQLKNKD